MCIARSHLVALLHTVSKVDFQHIYGNAAVLVQAGWCCWNLPESLLYPLISHLCAIRKPCSGILTEAARKGDCLNTDW